MAETGTEAERRDRDRQVLDPPGQHHAPDTYSALPMDDALPKEPEIQSAQQKSVAKAVSS